MATLAAEFKSIKAREAPGVFTFGFLGDEAVDTTGAPAPAVGSKKQKKKKKKKKKKSCTAADDLGYEDGEDETSATPTAPADEAPTPGPAPADGPLVEACRAGNLAEMARLLAAGADINTKGLKGMTPLHWACRKGHEDMAVQLCEHGANVHAVCAIGSTAMDYDMNMELRTVLKERGLGALLNAPEKQQQQQQQQQKSITVAAPAKKKGSAGDSASLAVVAEGTKKKIKAASGKSGTQGAQDDGWDDELEQLLAGAALESKAARATAVEAPTKAKAPKKTGRESVFFTTYGADDTLGVCEGPKPKGLNLSARRAAAAVGASSSGAAAPCSASTSDPPSSSSGKKLVKGTAPSFSFGFGV